MGKKKSLADILKVSPFYLKNLVFRCHFLYAFLSILLLTATSIAKATDLIDVYHQALDCDPTFKAAYSKFLSQSEALPQAWSYLLPQLTVNALAGRNQTLVDAGVFQINQTYNGNVWQVNASQALFNFQAWSNIQQAKATVKSALATFNDAAQDLMLRTTSSYLNVLLAKDSLNYADAKKRANQRQLNQAKQRYNVGLEPITSVYEAEAAYNQSIADVISAKNKLSNETQNLSKLTNQVYDSVSGLRDNKIPLISPIPNNVDVWVATGVKQNYHLSAAKYNLIAARENIKANSAGNWPEFTIQGNASDTHNDVQGSNQLFSPSINASNINSLLNSVFIPKEQRLSTVSINMHLPIFQGGLVLSNTRQAQYNFQTSSQDMEKTYRDVVVNSKIAFNTIIDGISKVKADRNTIFSQAKSLNSVEAQYAVGTRTMTDVVNAQEHLFQAQEQLASDQYALINSILNLKYLAGTLNVNDLEKINSWLNTPRTAQIATKE